MNSNKNDIGYAAAERERIIVRTSITGIGANVLLAVFKAFVGIVSHSIAVTLDAVNNLSDAMSSVVTIIGAKLGAKKPDKKHPLGYGRIEYLSSLIVATLVLYAGITSLVESVKKIIHPETPEYGIVSLIIISVAIAVKLILGRYVKGQGEKVNSGALIASGSDATFDAVLSSSVLLSAIIFLLWGISLEAYVGVVIAGFIIKAGLEMMKDTVDDIIGSRIDKEMSHNIKEVLTSEPEVLGAYDLTLYNYGPDRNYGTVHLELPDTMTVDKVDRLTRRVQYKVYCETGIILTGIGVYSHNTSDEKAMEMRQRVEEKVLSHDWALQIHGFYADTESRTIRFDTVISFDKPSAEGVAELVKEVKEMYPDFDVYVFPDVDVAD
ncbi:MAG: cation transporter [Oscillospiraceae bacterium]|nr:cation transporter [Oscillospiraceae bacterium]